MMTPQTHKSKRFLYFYEKTKMSRIFYFLLMLCLSNNLILTQTTAVGRAETLKGNVVSISALGEDGFGFITGEWQDELLIVTAAHVVEAARDSGEAVDIKFFNDYHEYKGTVIRVLSNDIALLSVKKPDNLKWQVFCLGFAREGDDAAFIGRNSDWYIPVGRNYQGTINHFQGNSIIVDILSVQSGTSGAPLITASGIVGMIVATDGVETTVITNSTLRNALNEYPNYFQLENTNGEIRDRDGNPYPTNVMKDGKRWMTKNLTINVSGSYCYNNSPINCQEYGRLYSWEAAKKGCESLGYGWKLPKDNEWRELAMSYGGIESNEPPGTNNYKTFKDPQQSYSQLIKGGNSGFNARLGGRRYENQNGEVKFLEQDSFGFYWTRSPIGSSEAWRYYFNGKNKKLYRINHARQLGFSVRCIKD